MPLSRIIRNSHTHHLSSVKTNSKKASYASTAATILIAAALFTLFAAGIALVTLGIMSGVVVFLTLGVAILGGILLALFRSAIRPAFKQLQKF